MSLEARGTNEGTVENTPSGPARGAFANRREFAAYAWFRIVQTRRYWLLPVLVLILAFSTILNVFTGYNVLPAIYSLIP